MIIYFMQTSLIDIKKENFLNDTEWNNCYIIDIIFYDVSM